jgi:hypothetical protein
VPVCIVCMTTLKVSLYRAFADGDPFLKAVPGHSRW